MAERLRVRRPAELPSNLRGAAFTTAQARASGVSAERLRRRDLEHPLHGVHVHAPAPRELLEHPWDRAIAAHLAAAQTEVVRMPRAAVFSHVTAAVAHGFPVSWRRVRASVLHVTVRSDGERHPRKGIKTHPLPRASWRRVWKHGLPVTDEMETWCALSAMLTVDELVAIGDHLVRRKRPDATMEQLAVAVARYAGRRGVKRLRTALDLVRPRTDSATETDLRLIVTRAGIREPAINAPLHDRDGLFVKHGDLVFEAERVLLEYDGEQHRTDSAQYARDAADMERLAMAGWLIIRVRKGELRHPDVVAARVRAALASRTSPTR